MEEETDNNPIVNESENVTSNYPWYIRELKNSNIFSNLKKLFFIGLIIIGIYYSFKIFSWYFLFGFVTLPVGLLWGIRQLDKERYILIEVSLKGDSYDIGKLSDNTATNVYFIPPEVWHNLKVKGSPYMVGHRTYICDKFQGPDGIEPGTIHFADHPSFSNMNFYTRLKLWLELKKKIPKVMEDLAIFKHNTEILAQERAIKILEKMKALEDFQEDKSKFMIKVESSKVLRNE